jgi:hypothetical protein
LDRDGKRWTCGIEARDRLIKKAGGTLLLSRGSGGGGLPAIKTVEYRQATPLRYSSRHDICRHDPQRKKTNY